MVRKEEQAAIDRIFNAADSCSPDGLRGPILEELRRAAAEEREACAKIADQYTPGPVPAAIVREIIARTPQGRRA
jgi:hypothetical protein